MRSFRLLIALAITALSSACAEPGGRLQARQAPVTTMAPVPAPAAGGRAPAAPYPAEPDGLAVMRFAFEEGDLFGCYTRLLRATDEKGKVVLQFSILPDGRVEGAQVLESAFSEETTACVVDRVSGWSTPFRPSKRKIFRVPMTFD